MKRSSPPGRLARRVLRHLAPLLAIVTLALPSLAEDPEEPASASVGQPVPPAAPVPAPSGSSPPAAPSVSPATTPASVPSAEATGVPPPPVVDESVADDDPRALTEFRSRLDPHGTWVEDPTYGRIWVPDRRVVGERFAPYVSSGHWSKADDGSWIWVSDHAFGDVVFHHGRWVWTRYGWAWIPGYRYASAWVEWRGPTPSYAYHGWSPAPPTFVWVSGVAVHVGHPSPYYWVFCPSHHVFAPYPYGYIVTHPVYVRTLARRTRHLVPAWPLPRARPLAPASVPASAVVPTGDGARPRAAVQQAKAPPLTRIPYQRQGAAMGAVEPRPRFAPRPAAPPPDVQKRRPPPLEPVRPAVRSEPRRVVSPPPKVYRPGHGNAPARRR